MMVNDSIRFHAESGQTMAEYAMVISVITLAIITAFSLLSNEIGSAFERTLTIVSSAF